MTPYTAHHLLDTAARSLLNSITHPREISADEVRMIRLTALDYINVVAQNTILVADLATRRERAKIATPVLAIVMAELNDPAMAARLALEAADALIEALAADSTKARGL